MEALKRFKEEEARKLAEEVRTREALELKILERIAKAAEEQRLLEAEQKKILEDAKKKVDDELEEKLRQLAENEVARREEEGRLEQRRIEEERLVQEQKRLEAVNLAEAESKRRQEEIKQKQEEEIKQKQEEEIKQKQEEETKRLKLKEIEEAKKKDDAKNHDIKCEDCKQPVIGVRFKCANCESYDICEACEAKNVHRNDHVFLKIVVPWKQNFKFVLPNFYQYQDSTSALNPSIPIVLPVGYQTVKTPVNEPTKTYADVLNLKPAPKQQLFTGSPYKYAKELEAIKDIFGPESNVDYIKSLLEKHKGSQDAVITEMLDK